MVYLRDREIRQFFWVLLPYEFLWLFLNIDMLYADEEKKMNATYIISIARKLGCSIFLLPEDITEVLWTVSLIVSIYF